MTTDSLLKKAEELYSSKKYGDVVRATMQIMEKEKECDLQVYLLSAKALICMATDLNDTGLIQNMRSTIDLVMRRITSYAQYRKVRQEIMEAVAELERTHYKILMDIVVQNPTFEQHQAICRQGLMHSLFTIKISSDMNQHPNIEPLIPKTKKDEADNITNAFTDEEKYGIQYDAGVRIFENAQAYFKRNINGNENIVPQKAITALSVSHLLCDLATQNLEKESVQAHLSRLEKNKEMIQAVLSMRMHNGTYQILSQEGVRIWRGYQQDVIEKATKIKEKEAQRRIAAYWEAHAEEKAQLDTELREKEKLLKEVDHAVEKAEQGIAKLREQEKLVLPIEVEQQNQSLVVSDLETAIENCWFFQKKKKQQLEETLQTVELPKLEELKKQAATKRNAKNQDISAKISKFNYELSQQKKEQTALSRRIKEIKKELTMPR